jgi:hypothetical protein
MRDRVGRSAFPIMSAMPPKATTGCEIAICRDEPTGDVAWPPAGTSSCNFIRELPLRAHSHRAKPPGRGPMGSLCFRRGDEFLGRRISPLRLRDALRAEIQVEVPQSRSGRPPRRAQNVYSRSVVASMSDCGWGTAPPQHCNPTTTSSTMDRFVIDHLQIKRSKYPFNMSSRCRSAASLLAVPLVTQPPQEKPMNHGWKGADSYSLKVARARLAL